MKLLKIESYCGHFLTESGAYESIDKIAKNDLLRMVDSVLNEDVEFDEYDQEQLKNQAHQVVYKSIYDNLTSLQKRKAEFIDESERMYLDDYKRYMENSPQQGG
ncbi:MAG: hypothetical protein ABW125_18900 [Candidatus Thiodiazotropha lotti]